MRNTFIGLFWILIFTGSVFAEGVTNPPAAKVSNSIVEKVVTSQAEEKVNPAAEETSFVTVQAIDSQPEKVSTSSSEQNNDSAVEKETNSRSEGEQDAADEKTSVIELPPFAERYPPESITSVERAEEIIEAYQKEISEINAWQSKVNKLCYREFLVNRCMNKNKEVAREKRGNARAVWLKARDFIREKNANEAKTQRLENEKKRAELVTKMNAQPSKVKGTGLVGSDPNSDIDTRGMMHVYDGKRTDVNPKNVKTGEKFNMVEPRVLTPEEEKKNEEAYWKRQQKREEQERQEEERKQAVQPPVEPAPRPMTVEEFEKDDAAPKETTSGGKFGVSGPRTLTPEQEKKNEETYEKRQQKREEQERQTEERKQGTQPTGGVAKKGMTVEEFEKADAAPASGRSSMSGPRVLTPEQEKQNEETYERRQQEQIEKIQQAEGKKPNAPSTTEEEREKSREERRIATEKKRQENIRKREERAADYEKQVKLREEQKQREEAGAK